MFFHHCIYYRLKLFTKYLIKFFVVLGLFVYYFFSLTSHRIKMIFAIIFFCIIFLKFLAFYSHSILPLHKHTCCPRIFYFAEENINKYQKIIFVVRSKLNIIFMVKQRLITYKYLHQMRFRPKYSYTSCAHHTRTDTPIKQFSSTLHFCANIKE